MEAGELRPDFGPELPHRRAGATLVTARPPLAAFNVELDSGDVEVARAVAAGLRESGGGLPGVRAIGLLLSSGRAQVSTNVHDPLAVPLGDGGRAGAGAGGAARRPPARGGAGRPDPGRRPAGYPADVPMRGFDPRAARDRAAARRPLEPIARFSAMAQTKKKRQRKRRGTQGGRIDTKPPRQPAQPRRGESPRPRQTQAGGPNSRPAADLAQLDHPRPRRRRRSSSSSCCC